MKKLVKALPEQSPVLRQIGEYFQKFGMCPEALQSFVKLGDTKLAMDCCILLNHWELAVDLAATHEFPQIEQLLSKHASTLLEKNRVVEAIHLCRKGNKSMEAAQLLIDLAKKQTTVNRVYSAFRILHFRK